MEKCNSLFYKHFIAISVTKLYFTYILFIGNFVPTSSKVANLFCQNIFIALTTLQILTLCYHSGKYLGKPCFRLNIKWCILSYCPLKCMCLYHNSFSSVHHDLMPFPLWGIWSPECGWVAEKWITLACSADYWVKNFRAKLLSLLILTFFFFFLCFVPKLIGNTPSFFDT